MTVIHLCFYSCMKKNEHEKKVTHLNFTFYSTFRGQIFRVCWLFSADCLCFQVLLAKKSMALMVTHWQSKSHAHHQWSEEQKQFTETKMSSALHTKDISVLIILPHSYINFCYFFFHPNILLSGQQRFLSFQSAKGTSLPAVGFRLN